MESGREDRTKFDAHLLNLPRNFLMLAQNYWMLTGMTGGADMAVALRAMNLPFDCEGPATRSTF
jgi:hypothetical protein